jgi:hypothetical protein
MQLKVPVIRQKSIESIECGIVGLRMLFEYYKDEESAQDLETLKLYENVGTYMPQLGIYLLEREYQVEIITANPHLFTLKHAELSQKDLLLYLKNYEVNLKLERFREPLKFFISFIDKGGKLTVKVPSKEDIIEEIENERPVCALLTTNIFVYDKPCFNFHFNLITGIEDNFVYVNDPIPDLRGGNHKYDINDFFYGLYSSAYGDIDNASIMKVKKRKVK